MMVLETKRLLMRPFAETDAEDLYAYASDPRVGPRAGWAVHKSVRQSRKYIKTIFTNPYDLALVLKETGRVIGSGGFVNRHRDWLPGDNDELGYSLSPLYWGRGLMPEAMAEFIRFGFLELALDHIWCGYFDGNEQSHRVQQKLGFVPDRSIWVDIPALKERRLEHYSVLTRDRWEALRYG